MTFDAMFVARPEHFPRGVKYGSLGKKHAQKVKELYRTVKGICVKQNMQIVNSFTRQGYVRLSRAKWWEENWSLAGRCQEIMQSKITRSAARASPRAISSQEMNRLYS